MAEKVRVVVKTIDNSGAKKRKKPDCVPINLLDTSIDLLPNLFGVAEDDGSGKARELKDFFDRCHRQRPSVYRGNQKRLELLKETLFDFEVKTMLENTASDQIHVWMAIKPEQDSSADKPAGLESFTVEDPNQAYIMFRAGHSLYCRAPAQLESAVIGRALNEVGIAGMGMKGDRFRRGEIETFFSRKGHNTDFHIDFQDNFTIQLTGSKKWIFKNSSSGFPIRGCTPHFSSSAGIDVAEQQLKVHRLGSGGFSADEYKRVVENENEKKVSVSRGPDSSKTSRKNVKTSQAGGVLDNDGSDESIVIRAGDVMYHPAGIWHRVECIEDSISINISLIGSTYSEIFCSGLQQLLWENTSFRTPVASDREAALQVMKRLMSTVGEAMKALEAKDFCPLPCFEFSDTSVESSNKESSGELSKRKKRKGEEEGEVEEEDDDNGGDDGDDDGDDDEDQSRKPVIIDVRDQDMPQEECSEMFLRTFRFNPLSQIFSVQDLDVFGCDFGRLLGLTTNSISGKDDDDDDDDDDEEEEEEEGEEVELEEEEEEDGSGDGEDDGWEEVSSSQSDDETSPAAAATNQEGLVYYLVNTSFGNETIESLSRCALCLPSHLQSVMSFLLQLRAEHKEKLWKVLDKPSSGGCTTATTTTTTASSVTSSSSSSLVLSAKSVCDDLGISGSSSSSGSSSRSSSSSSSSRSSSSSSSSSSSCCSSSKERTSGGGGGKMGNDGKKRNLAGNVTSSRKESSERGSGEVLSEEQAAVTKSGKSWVVVMKIN